MQGNPELKAWQQEGGTVIGTSVENICARMAGDCAGRFGLAEELVRRFNGHKELVEALRPFAGYACDEPHVDEPDCHNCRARTAIARVGEKTRLRAAASRDPGVGA